MAYRRRQFAGLGEDAGSSGDWYNAADYFRDARSKLNWLEDAIRKDPDLARQISSQVLDAENQYQSLLAPFLVGYRAAFGTVPSGVSGLGTVPVVAIVGAAAAIAAISYLVVYVIQPLIQTAQATAQAKLAASQAQSQAQANLADLQKQYAAAKAAGDDVTAAQIATMIDKLNASGAGAPNPPSDFGQWLQDNWLPVTLVVGGIAILPKIL